LLTTPIIFAIISYLSFFYGKKFIFISETLLLCLLTSVDIKTPCSGLLMVKKVTYWRITGRGWRWRYFRDTRHIDGCRFAVGFQGVFYDPVICSLMTAVVIFNYSISSYAWRTTTTTWKVKWLKGYSHYIHFLYLFLVL